MPGAFLLLICSKTGRMLLNKRSRFSKHSPGEWFAFGGTIDGNESPYKAMIREIKEEANIDSSTIDIFDPPLYTQRLMGADGLSDIHMYLGLCEEELPILIQKEECEDYGWFKPNDLTGLRLHPTIRSILSDRSVCSRLAKYMKL